MKYCKATMVDLAHDCASKAWGGIAPQPSVYLSTVCWSEDGNSAVVALASQYGSLGRYAWDGETMTITRNIGEEELTLENCRAAAEKWLRPEFNETDDVVDDREIDELAAKTYLKARAEGRNTFYDCEVIDAY